MVEHLLEVIQKPKVLYERIHPPPEPKLKPTSESLNNLMTRLKMRKWVPNMENWVMVTVQRLRDEVKFIEHLPGCYMCKISLELDVERYMGNHSFWWCSLENGEYLEQRYRNCPKERNYHIGNYWEQLQYYRQHGNCNVPGENTRQFILDRAKWAYGIYGKQIHTLRRLLRMIRTWDYFANQDEALEQFYRIYNRLGMYDISFPCD